MDDKLTWFFDWDRRGRPVEWKGKTYYLPIYIPVNPKPGFLMLIDQPDRHNNQKRRRLEIDVAPENEVKPA